MNTHIALRTSWMQIDSFGWTKMIFLSKNSPRNSIGWKKMALMCPISMAPKSNVSYVISKKSSQRVSTAVSCRKFGITILDTMTLDFPNSSRRLRWLERSGPKSQLCSFYTFWRTWRSAKERNSKSSTTRSDYDTHWLYKHNPELDRNLRAIGESVNQIENVELGEPCVEVTSLRIEPNVAVESVDFS